MNIIEISKGIKFNTSNCHLTFNDKIYNLKKDYRDVFLSMRAAQFEQKNKIIHTISLTPTYECDGRCSYCYNINEINKQHDNLTFDQFDNTISKLKENGYIIDLKTIRLYGGEPLLSNNLSNLIIKIYEKYKFKTLYISSGLLFDDNKFNHATKELTKLINKNIPLTIGVSVDFGLPDKGFTRVCSTTKITRDILLDRCSILEDIGVRVVYATIVSKNTKIELLKKHITNHYIEKSNKFDLSKMDSKKDRDFAYRISISNHNKLYPSIKKVEFLYNMYKELYSQIPITSNLYPYTDVIYSPKIIKIDPDNFLFLFPNNYCGIYTDMIAIFPNGEVGSCHMNPYDRNLKPTDEQSDYFFNNKKCKECNFFGICRGLCVNRNLQAADAMDSYCLWAKFSFELALKRMFLLHNENFKEYINGKSIQSKT